MTLRFRFQCHHQFPREGRPMAAGRGHAATVPWILVAKWTRMEIGNRWWWTHQTLDWFKGKSTGKTKPIFGGKKNMVSGFNFPLNQPIESNILKFHPTNMSFKKKCSYHFISRIWRIIYCIHYYLQYIIVLAVLVSYILAYATCFVCCHIHFIVWILSYYIVL